MGSKKRSDHTNRYRCNREFWFLAKLRRRHLVVSNQIVVYSCELLERTGLQVNEKWAKLRSSWRNTDWETVAGTGEVAWQQGKVIRWGTYFGHRTHRTDHIYTGHVDFVTHCKYPQEYLLSVIPFLILTCPYIKTDGKMWTISQSQA